MHIIMIMTVIIITIIIAKTIIIIVTGVKNPESPSNLSKTS
jgi:hypothetical protein